MEKKINTHYKITAMYASQIISLCRERRGTEKLNKSIGNDRLMLQFIMPLSEVILDFHDTLKSISSGYASFDYEDHDYQTSNIVKVTIKLMSYLYSSCAQCRQFFLND